MEIYIKEFRSENKAELKVQKEFVELSYSASLIVVNYFIP